MIKLLRHLRYRIHRKIYGPTDPVELESIRWVADNGDNTLRLNYDLDCNSIVWDLGGYKGDFAAAMYCKYSCNVDVFEPITEYLEECKSRFLKSPKIKLFNFGLGPSNKILEFKLSNDATSLYIDDGEVVNAEIKNILDFISDQGLESVDLVKINIEGAEFELLAHMIDYEIIGRFKNIQVQFHQFIPDAEFKYSELAKRLSKTHKLEWSYRFIWESWRKI